MYQLRYRFLVIYEVNVRLNSCNDGCWLNSLNMSSGLRMLLIMLYVMLMWVGDLVLLYVCIVVESVVLSSVSGKLLMMSVQQLNMCLLWNWLLEINVISGVCVLISINMISVLILFVNIRFCMNSWFWFLWGVFVNIVMNDFLKFLLRRNRNVVMLLLMSVSSVMFFVGRL